MNRVSLCVWAMTDYRFQNHNAGGDHGRHTRSLSFGTDHLLKKSRLCLKEKGLPYQSHYISLNKFEHHDPAYLKLNPNGLRADPRP